MDDVDHGHFDGGWDDVINQSAGQKLAGGVVDDLFVKRGANALRNAAMHLAVNNHRIDDAAAILGDHVLRIFTKQVAESISTMAR